MEARDITGLVRAAEHYLRARCTREPELGQLLGAVGDWLSGLAREVGAGGAAAEGEGVAAERGERVAERVGGRAAEGIRPTVIEPPGVRGPTGIVPLKIGDSTVHIRVAGTTDALGRARASADAAEAAGGIAAVGGVSGMVGAAGSGLGTGRLRNWDGPDLNLLVKRCRLKAESCRLFALRRAAEGLAHEQDMIAQVNAMIDQAKSMPDCFLWSFFRGRPQPDDARLERIARCYEAAAAAAGLIAMMDAATDAFSDEDLQPAFQMLAEAGSALRVALQDTWLTAPDIDEEEAHAWLRQQTVRRQIFVPRFMRREDPADPDRVDELTREIEDFRVQCEETAKKSKESTRLLQQIRFHAKRLPADGAGDPHDCKKISEAVEALLGSGFDARDRRVQEAVKGIRPEAFGPEAPVGDGLQKVLTAGAASVPAGAESGEGDERKWSTRVLEARELLRQCGMVVIGGERRPESVDRIREAFELGEVEWVRLSEHSSGEPMRAPIQRPSTAVVVVLIKLAGHLHAEEANEYARAAGKPCVFLKAGYNPEQIAEAVLQQAGDRLREGRVTTEESPAR